MIFDLGPLPSTWNTKFDVYQLDKIFSDFIQSKKEEAQIQGVVQRDERKPVDISFHLFLNHPFGRDYRQDPIGLSPRDKPFYEEDLSNIKDVLVKPVLAREILKEELKKSKRFGKLRSKDSEFAREMLMFPLSIKNPNVALMGSRSRKRASPPKKDLSRASEGPERLVITFT